MFLAGWTCPVYFTVLDRFGRIMQDRGSTDLKDGDSGLEMITDGRILLVV